MSIAARAFRKVLVLLAPAAIPSPASSTPVVAAAEAARPAAALSMLVKNLEEDPATRARFAQDPRTILREAGLDPEPFDVGPSLSDADIARLVGRWKMAQAAGRPQAPSQQQQDSGRGSASPDERSRPRASPPVAVYGPPPSLSRPSQDRPPVRPQTPPPAPSPPPPAPPAPVYGPPPGPR